MKKLILLLLLPGVGFCDEFKLPNLQSGMYSNEDANKIPDNSASYIANFTTDIQDLAVERNGYVKRDTTVLGGTKPVYGLWDYTDSNGNNWIISYSSRTYYKNTIGQTPTAFGPISTTDQIPDCAKNLGKIMCVNGIDLAWTFDGTSTASVAGAPLGTIIEPWRTRFVISNIVNSKSTVRVSADGLETSWTLGPLATDPFAFQIGGANDGEYVRCLVGSYLDSMIIGRRNDLWALDGFDQSDFNVRNISYQIGCIEPRSPQEIDGELVFLSARGLEAMNGRQIRQISDPIRNITDFIVKNTVNQHSNLQTSASDWGAGTSNNPAWIDTITTSGNLQLTFPDFFTTLRDGTSGSKSVWTKYCYTPFGACTPNITVVNGNATLAASASADGQTLVASNNSILGTTAGTTYYLKISSITPNSLSANNQLSLMIYNTGTTTSDPRTIGTGVYFSFKSTNTGNFFLYQVGSSIGGAGTADGCMSCAGDVPNGTQVFMYFNGSRYLVSFSNGINNVTGALTVGNFNGIPYLSYRDAVPATSSAQIDEFGLAPISASIASFLIPTTTSQLLTIGNSISSWGPVTISDVKTGGTINYRFGSTTTASLAAINNYTSISNGQIPSAAVGAYAAFQSSFTQTFSSGTLALESFLTTWNEGGVIPSPVSFIYDRRYWLSFTTATTSVPSLDTILIWQRNKSFSLFKGINAGSFAYWRDNLYFGNSNSTGYVYKFDTGNNDDGSDISSMIVTKSYDLGQFFRDKEFSKAYLGYLGGSSQSGSFSLSYDLNRYGTLYSLGTVNLTEEQGQGAAKFWFPLNQLVRGREIQYTLTKSGTGSRLRFYDLATEFYVKEEK